MSMVTSVGSNSIGFDDQSVLYSEHESDCCERHYLSFENLTLADFKGLDFDLSGNFFERVEDYGIRLLPLNGHPIPVPGYGYNSGYYSRNLTLILWHPNQTTTFDISECQVIAE